MMGYVLFILISFVEYLAIFSLMFSTFKINYRWYKAEIIFVCVTLTFISLTMRENELTLYNSVAQLLIWTVYMWLLFRFSLLHAAIMTICSFFAYGLIQSSVAILTLQFVSDLAPMTLRTHMMALISGIAVFPLANLIYRKNWGFSFVPMERKTGMNYQDKIKFLFILVIVCSIIGYFAAYTFLVFHANSLTFLILAITTLVCLGGLLYLSVQEEIRKYVKKR